MSTVHAKTEIDAPIQRVWDTVMDPDRLQDWVTIHRSVDHISSRPLTTGSTMRQHLHVRGVSFHVNWTLIEVTAPSRAEWRGRGPAHSHASISYKLSETDSGGTLFEYTNEFTTPGGRLGQMASRVIVGPASEREANHSLARLKQLLERG